MQRHSSPTLGTLCLLKLPESCSKCFHATSSCLLDSGQHLQVVGVVHVAQDVPKGINHRSCHESMPPILRCFKLLRAHRDGSFQHGVYIVDVPVDDDTSSTGCAVRAWRILGVNQTQFLLVVAEPKLAVA